MDAMVASAGAEFWTRANRHMLNFGGHFVPFVPVRAEGCSSTTPTGGACWISPPAR